MPPFPTHHTKALPNHPTFLLLHGFPSTPETWSKLTPHLTRAGYGILALDLRICGDASQLPKLEDYALSSISTRVATAIKDAGLDTVIGVGHDWGAALLARLWWYHPDVLSALVFMGVPYQEPGVMDLEGMNKVTEEMFGVEVGGYWGFLLGEGAGEVLAENTPSALSLFYQSSPTLWKTHLCPRSALQTFLTSSTILPLPPWLSPEDFSSMVSAFQESGWHHPITWYKAALEYTGKGPEANLSNEQLVVNRPVVFVAGEEDVVGRVEFVRFAAEAGREKGYLPDVEVECMKGVAHWMMLEAVEETLGILDRVGKRVKAESEFEGIQEEKEHV